MKVSAAASLVLGLALTHSSEAVRLQLEGKRNPLSALAKRADLSAPPVTNSSVPVLLADAGDTRYLANITIGGESKIVLIDTGSTDLVMFEEIAGAVNTSVPASVVYGAGEVDGFIYSGTVEFGGYEIHHQAFISGNPLDGFPGDGILGVALFTDSNIQLALNHSPGAFPFIDNAFAANTSTPNFISFLLQRLDDPDQNITAQLTIGEIVPGYENVTSMPQIPVVAASESGHWEILVDSVIGPNGQAVEYTSIVEGAPKAVAVLDTGAPIVLVPQVIADAFYANATGSVLNSDLIPGQPIYVVDCKTELTASFVIGNTTYNIHPLDMTIPFPLDNGTTICAGAFAPNTLDASFAFFDFLLGDPFLRNVYAVLNYGDFVGGKTNETADPYAQLLPLTDLTKAHQEFVDARLTNGTAVPGTPNNGTSSPPPPTDDNTDSSSSSPSPTDSASSADPSSDSSSDPSSDPASDPSSDPSTDSTAPPTEGVSKDLSVDDVKQAASNAADKAKKIAIIVAAVVGGVVLIGIALCLVCCCGVCGLYKRRSFGFKGRETREVYRPLHVPAPQSHADEYGSAGHGQYYGEERKHAGYQD